MTLSASFERLELPLETPFTIARGTQTVSENVVVRVADDEGRVGVGGAAPARHYGETADTVAAVLPDLLSVVEDVGDPHQRQRIERRMRETVRDNPAARCAVSIALHDLIAKRADLPLYRYWGLDPDRTVSTSFTIGLDDPDRMHEKAADAVAAGHEVLKVKVGTDRDEAVVDAVRSAAPDARIRVDANEAWTPREAVRMSETLADYGVEFIEQPVPAENPEGLQFVYERSALPIAADESCVTVDDVPRVADRTDIVTIKLMKCGGLAEARRMVHAARAQGLEVMLGCMVESNASIAAGAHLAPLLDYADLDGSLLLDRDPFAGVPMPDGVIDLASVDRPGTGAVPR
ncbi:dipeptide epimerase [Halostella salina]|uniref:dipeptide epimerase n=1 Tax=Halostella salina TaxID=1547897 RepID=UPI000EF7F676|nr:dipeptide epimerase [Halostella salina]